MRRTRSNRYWAPRAALVGLGFYLALALATGTAAADIGDLRAAAKKPPKDPAAALELGRDLRRAGLYTEAHRVLKGASAGSSGLGPTLRLEGVRALLAAGSQKAALRECGELKKASKVAGEICESEAQLLWKRGSLALPAAERALDAEPHNYDALVARGRALGHLGQPAEAESAFKQAMGVDGARYEAPWRMGELLGSNGDKSGGVAALKQAQSLEAREPDLLLALAAVLGDAAERVKLLEAAVAIRPDFPPALSALGEALLDTGKLAEAEAALKKAILLNKKDAAAHVAIGRVQLAKGNADEALKAANLALKIVANHAGAKLLQADALAGKGDIDLAIEAYEAAYGYARTEPAALVHAARACLDGKRPTTAAAFAERATQEFPNWGPAWEIAGDVAKETGDKPAAKADYQKALAGAGPIDKSAIKAKIAALK